MPKGTQETQAKTIRKRTLKGIYPQKTFQNYIKSQTQPQLWKGKSLLNLQHRRK